LEGVNGAGNRTVGDYLLQVYKSQLPVVEHGVETAVLMLGGYKSRRYCLEMILRKLLGGSKYGNEDPEVLHDSSLPATYVLTKNFAVVCKTLHIAFNWQKSIAAVNN
jgi:hypothetical protein